MVITETDQLVGPFIKVAIWQSSSTCIKTSKIPTKTKIFSVAEGVGLLSPLKIKINFYDSADLTFSLFVYTRVQ